MAVSTSRLRYNPPIESLEGGSMTIDTPEMQTILRRIETVEKENRQLRRIGLSVVLMAIVVFGMGQASPTPTVEASKFVLRDTQGRARAELGMDMDNPTLTFHDSRGYPLIALTADDEPFLVLNRAGNEEQVTLTAGKDVYGLTLFGKERRKRAMVAVHNDSPAFSLFDEAGKERVVISLLK
jgi:hypothetical protein